MQTQEKAKYVRSPFFYVGDKFKLLEQIVPHFPGKFDRIIEPFVGGGSVFLNATTKEAVVNDIDPNVINIHKLLYSHGERMEEFISEISRLATNYGLSCSFTGTQIPDDLKNNFPKTYFAEINKMGFMKLKEKYNDSQEKDVFELYVLMIYGFNRMLRFNKDGKFNIPVGNVDFNKNVVDALHGYSKRTAGRNIAYYNLEFEEFLNSIELNENDFLYVDPPYLITSSEYNKGWDESCETRLYDALDNLNERRIKFALSNVELYKGKINNILENWMKKYSVYTIKSNYINYFDNGKKTIKEVLVCNYE